MVDQFFLLAAGMYLAWSLGANNAANIIGTAVGSRTLSYNNAILFMLVCLGIGSIFFGDEVVKTVSSGIVSENLITTRHATIALLVAAAWVHYSTYKKRPVSISQSVVSSVLGVGIAESILATENLVLWDTVVRLALVWLFSPVIGFLVGQVVFRMVHGFIRHKHLYLLDTIRETFFHPVTSVKELFSGTVRRREHLFHWLLLISAAYMALAMGANTLAATTGLVYSGLNGQISLLNVSVAEFDVLFIVEILVLVFVIFGIMTYGKNLTSFMATQLRRLDALRGSLIQFVSASVILFAALNGYPVSTTGVFVGAFLGVDSGEENPQIKKHTSRELISTFFYTVPITAVLSAVLTLVVSTF